MVAFKRTLGLFLRIGNIHLQYFLSFVVVGGCLEITTEVFLGIY
jgi:hypothetical protein